MRERETELSIPWAATDGLFSTLAPLIFKLDAARFEDALGLAGTQSAGLMAAQYEAMCKRMHHGFSARNGLYAAVLAEGGYTGIKRVFERPYGGFLSTFGEGHEPEKHRHHEDHHRHYVAALIATFAARVKLRGRASVHGFSGVQFILMPKKKPKLYSVSLITISFRCLRT